MDTGDRRRGTPRDAAERDEVDTLFEGAHTDPEFDAIGHPPDSKLAEIAAGRVDQDDPVFDHIEICSRCFKRMRELLESATVPAQTTRRRGARWWVAGIIAAGLLLALLVAGAVRWRLGGHSVVPGGTSARLVAELDLRPYDASRGEGNEVQPLVLRRGVVDLMMILPTGAEVGRYDIQLLDDGPGDLKSRTSTTAEGTLKKYGTEVRTEVRTELDLSDVPPGRYQLAIRYAAERWRLFPVEVR